MKKLLILLLLTSLSANSQILISWYNSDTYDFLYSEYVDVQPPCDTVIVEGVDIHRCTTTALKTGNWAKTKYDIENGVFYNAATPQEQEVFEAGQEAAAVSIDAILAINKKFTTTKTDAQLNDLYPQPAPFLLFCENISGGIVYLKGSEGWHIIETVNNE